jgi:hypothetical protein
MGIWNEGTGTVCTHWYDDKSAHNDTGTSVATANIVVAVGAGTALRAAKNSTISGSCPSSSVLCSSVTSSFFSSLNILASSLGVDITELPTFFFVSEVCVQKKKKFFSTLLCTTTTSLEEFFTQLCVVSVRQCHACGSLKKNLAEK